MTEIYTIVECKVTYNDGYNEERLHGFLNYRTPEQFIKDFNENESKIKLGNENQITEVCQTVSDL